MSGWTDLGYSARSLARTPWLSLTLLLTIALGIGSNTAVAGFVRGLVARTGPIPGTDRLVSIFAADTAGGFGPVSYDDYRSIASHHELLESIGIARQARSIVILDGRQSVFSVASISRELSGLVQLPPSADFVVSHRLAHNQLDDRTDLHDVSLRIDDVEARVTGSAPEWLEGLYVGDPVDIWMPLPDASASADPASPVFWALGRLRAGVTPKALQTVLNAMRSRTEMIAVLPYTGMTPEVSAGMSRVGTLLTAASVAVFVIACANVVTFLLARAASRARDTCLRVALGATRRRLAMQVAADSFVISLAGGALGLLLARWTEQVVPALLFSEDAERLSFVPDVTASAWIAVAGAAMVLLCGLAPLLETRHDDPARILGRESAGPSKPMLRLRSVLVVVQMACCCILVISTAALFAGFRTALRTKTGSHLDDAVVATFEAKTRFSRPDLGLEYFASAEAAALSVPGISSAAWSGTPPGSRPGWQAVRFEPPEVPLEEVSIDVTVFTPRVLAEITLPPLAGRMFSGGDTPGSCRVVVVNEAASREIFGGAAVGQAIEGPDGRRAEVVGVVGNRTTGRPRRPTVYYYQEQTGEEFTLGGPARFRVTGRQARLQAIIETNVVSSSYFDTMGYSFIDGTRFNGDTGTGACRTGVINGDAARRYFDGRAVGGAIVDGSGRRTSIVGVVASPLLRASQRRGDPAVYLPMIQDFQPRMTMVAMAKAADTATVAAVRKAVEAVPGGLTPPVVTTLEEHLGKVALAPERIASVLVGACTAIALLLALLGVSSAVSDASRRRRREYALRIAIGAPGWRIVRDVLAEGTRLAAAGTVLGLAGSMLARRWLSGVTPDAGMLPVWPLVAAPLLLLAAVFVASLPAARRTLAVDPLTIMRQE